MKKYLTMEHESTQYMDSIEEFCKAKGLQFFGDMFRRKDHLRALNVTKIGEGFYTNIISSTSSNADSTGYTMSASFHLLEDFVLEDYMSKDECDIVVDVWDLTQDDEGPVYGLGYKESELKEAQEFLADEPDFDVWIKGEKKTREEFMAM